MKIEHFGYQVQDPQAVARWYCEQLGWTVRRTGGAPAHAQFVADASGAVMIEIYNNPRVAVPDYRSMDPLLLHIAISVSDPAVERDRLVHAGATVAEDLVTTPAGDQLVMLRDPWGMALQLVKRAQPMA